MLKDASDRQKLYAEEARRSNLEAEKILADKYEAEQTDVHDTLEALKAAPEDVVYAEEASNEPKDS